MWISKRLRQTSSMSHLESMISLEDQLKQGKLKVNNEEVEYGEEEDYD